MKIQLIYLAAGNSRRFGSNKLLYECNGKPLYQHLLERLLQIAKRHASWEVLVVTQYEEICEEILKAEALGWPVRVAFSPDSRKGVSYSIRAGISASAEETEGYAFFVADQPYLTEKSAEGFLEEMERRKAELGSVRCAGISGNPAWFLKEYGKELLALSGDSGGRKVLKRYPEKVVYYEIADDRELADIDEPCQN